jgi:hypothetical protein
MRRNTAPTIPRRNVRCAAVREVGPEEAKTRNLAGGLGALEGSRWPGRASGGRPVAGAHFWMAGRRRAWPAGVVLLLLAAAGN